MNEEFSYIFNTLFKNLQEMKEKPPWYHFEIYHMYVQPLEIFAFLSAIGLKLQTKHDFQSENYRGA